MVNKLGSICPHSSANWNCLPTLPHRSKKEGKQNGWKEGNVGYLLLLFVASTCVWFPANIEAIADLLNWRLKFEIKDPLLSRCFGKTNPEPTASHGLGVGTFLFAVLVG